MSRLLLLLLLQLSLELLLLLCLELEQSGDVGAERLLVPLLQPLLLPLSPLLLQGRRQQESRAGEAQGLLRRRGGAVGVRVLPRAVHFCYRYQAFFFFGSGLCVSATG